MLRWSNPARGFVLAVLLLVGFVVPTTALAGNTHSEGGPVLEAAGTPETDGAQATTYWAGDSSTRVSTTVGAVLSGHWLQDVGFNLTREWQVGDDHISVIELETNANQTTHKGYYGVINKTLTSLDPDEYPSMTVRAIPMPVATAGAGFIDLAWSAAAQDAGTPAMNNIAGYRVFRSTDGKTFAAVTDSLFTSLSFRDTSVTFGTTYYYALQLAYRGTPSYRGSKLSGNSNAASPLDVVPPDAPVLAGEPAFTPGTTNTIAWSDESASGATAYLAQASLDSAFASIAANSDWIAVTAFEFTGLQDGQTYYYRVRARDLGLNESALSMRVASTQDATAPASNLTGLTAYKTSSAVALEWTAADTTSGIAGVRLFVSKDGGDFAEYAGGPFGSSPIAFDAATLGGDGSYAFYTLAADAAGNVEAAPAQADASTIIDTQAPNAPALAALPAFAPGTSLLVAWDDQSASGATAYRLQASDSADFATILHETAWLAETVCVMSNLTDGATLHYRVQSRDAAGNPSAFSASASVTQDATAPASSAANPSLVDSLRYEIAWSASDATSGLQHVELWYARNGAAYAAYSGGPFTTSPILFDAAQTGGDGSYAFYTVAQDNAGNTEAAPATPDATLITDSVPPNAPTLAAMPQFIAGTSATLTWSSDGASAYRAEAASDSSFQVVVASSSWITLTQHTFESLTDGGTYFYRVQARDLAGNLSAWSAPLSAMQDATAPSSAVSALPALSNASLSIAWSGFDMVSGVQGVDLYYSREGSPFTLHPGSPFASSPIAFDAAAAGGDGVYAFFTRARDRAGNIESAPAAPDAQTRIDTAAPSMPLIVSMPQFSPGTVVVVQWSNEALSGAIEYGAELSDRADFSTILRTSGWVPSTSFVFNGLEDGKTYWFRSQSRDAALNTSPFSAAAQTTMDDLSPASRVDALPSVTPATFVDLAWTGSDATSGLADLDLYYALDGGAFTLYPGGPFTASPIRFDSNLTGGEGSYAFYTRARDRVGNREATPAAPDANTILTTATVSVVVMDELPEFTAGTSQALSWDAAYGATQYLVQAAEDPSFYSILGASGWITSRSYSFNSLVDGHTYYYRVRGRNDVGVTGVFSAVESSTQDNSPPASQVAPLTGSAQRTFDIVWSGSDATSGVAGVQLMVSYAGGTFAAYPGGPFTASPIAFDAAQVGGDGLYAFCTIATDRVGNVEAAPPQADAVITIDTQAPAIPTMLAEPADTRGDANTVAWNAVPGATQYHVQCALDGMFLNVIATSGWIPTTSHTFTDLETGTTYYYRVRSRDAANNLSAYSQPVWSTQSLGRVLTPGWNLISFDVTPEDARIDRVLSPIAGSFSIVRSYEDGQFNSYLPSLPVEMNDLQQLDPHNGYWIYMTRQDTLAVKGTALPDNTPIALNAGWELVSYLPDDVQTADVALGSIRESLVLARGYDQGYQSYYPALGSLSNLETLRPGFGYWLYMGANDELIYGQMATAAVETASRATQQAVSNKSNGSVVPTVMDLWSLEILLDGAAAPAGCTLEAWDAANNLIASTKLQQDGSVLLHVPGDVSITETDEGALPGEAITLRLKTAQGTLDLDTPVVFEADAAKELTIDVVLAELLPKVFSLAQNHPNPFNPSTRIAYAIPAGVEAGGTQVRLQVFDIRGRVVRTLVNTKQLAGRYAVQWDGSDDAGQPVSSGVYFYRLHTAQFAQTHKMMMVK